MKPISVMAQEVLVEVKKRMISSNDIIPRSKMTTLELKDLAHYIQEFGQEKVSEMLRYQQYATFLANLLPEERKRLDERKQKESLITVEYALGLMGVGECGEATIQALILLAEKGCSLPVTRVVLQGEKADGKSCEHALLVIGDCKKLGKDVSSFRKLANDCILLDPFINVSGQANKFMNLEKEYSSAYKLTKIVHTRTWTAQELASLLAAVQKEAPKMAGRWLLEYGTYDGYMAHPKAGNLYDEFKLLEGFSIFNKKPQGLGLCAELARITHNSNWTFDVKKGARLQGSKEELEAIVTYLNEHDVAIAEPKKLEGDLAQYGIAVNLVKMSVVEKMPAMKAQNTIQLD